MQPKPWPEIPVDTVRVAKKAFRKGSLAIRARDQLGAWCADVDFAGAYGVRGAPAGISPAQLAMVTVLQFCENLTDRQAADAVRGRLDWKYALGLPLADEGFDFSAPSEFRNRPVAAGAERVIFDLLLARLKDLGLVTAGGTARTDSTHVLARIRSLNRLELAGETVRAALEALAAAAPGWLPGATQRRPGRRSTGSGSTGGGCRAATPNARSWPSSMAATATCCWRRSARPAPRGGCGTCPRWRRCAGSGVQQYTRNEQGRVIRREAGPDGQGLPPGRLRIISPTTPMPGIRSSAAWAGTGTRPPHRDVRRAGRRA